MVNVLQITVTWHVDDLNIFHKDPQEVTKFILSMGKIYGEVITVTRDKFHSYLGVDFDFSTQGTTKQSMIKYAAQIINDFPEVLTTSVTSPSAEHLFQVRDNGKKKPPE